MDAMHVSIAEIAEAYAAPDLTFEDLRRSLRGGEFRDPLAKFSEACRAELHAVRARPAIPC